MGVVRWKWRRILGFCRGFAVLCADPVKPDLHQVVKAVVEPVGLDCLELCHPIVLPLLEKSPVL